MKQITIFDIIADEKPAVKTNDIPCGYIRDMRIVGRELEFQELKDFIGKKVIEVRSTESNQYYRVYKVIGYYEDCFTYYKRVKPLPDSDIGYGEIVNEFIHDVVGIKDCMACYEPYFTCDRVALSDNNGNKSNAVVCEAWCCNGRYDPFEMGLPTDEVVSFHEIKEIT